MVKQEFSKFFKSINSKVVFLIIMAFALVHTVDSVFFDPFVSKVENIMHPVWASFINGTSSALQVKSICLWLLPAFFTLAYCNKYVNEKKKGLINVYISREGRKKLFFSKTLVSFAMPSFLYMIPNLVSLILTVIFLHGNTDFYGLQYWSAEEAGEFLYFCVQNPYIAYLIFFVSSIILSGLLGVACQCMVFITSDTRVSLILSTAIWIGVYHTSYHMDVNMAMQPFNENGFVGFMISYIAFVPFVLIMLALGYWEIVLKKDEI